MGLSVHPEREEGDGGGGSRSTLLYLGGANQDDMFVSATLVWMFPCSISGVWIFPYRPSVETVRCPPVPRPAAVPLRPYPSTPFPHLLPPSPPLHLQVEQTDSKTGLKKLQSLQKSTSKVRCSRRTVRGADGEWGRGWRRGRRRYSVEGREGSAAQHRMCLISFQLRDCPHGPHI